MKAFTAVLVALIALFALAQGQSHNGRPGCQTQQEVTLRDWRNNNDPTRFWRCNSLGVAATEIRCRDLHGDDGWAFQQSRRACVLWNEWVWTPTEIPPSIA